MTEERGDWREPSGFTLFEILIVIGLATILVLTGVLFTMNRTITGQELDRARDLIRSNLTRAQADAMLSDSAWGVAFAENSFIRFKGSSFATHSPADDVVTEIPASVTVSGAQEVVFTPPESVPATAGMVTLTDGHRTVRISVNAAGAISVE